MAYMTRVVQQIPKPTHSRILVGLSGFRQLAWVGASAKILDNPLRRSWCDSTPT